jgi:hypothetical protein
MGKILMGTSIILVAILVAVFYIVSRPQPRQPIALPTPTQVPIPTATGYIPPTPVITGDWNYDGVVDEKDAALISH